MARDDTQELLDVLAATRQALKGLQRQARATLQLATDLEERLARWEPLLSHPRMAQGGAANGKTTHSTETLRV